MSAFSRILALTTTVEILNEDTMMNLLAYLRLNKDNKEFYSDKYVSELEGEDLQRFLTEYCNRTGERAEGRQFIHGLRSQDTLIKQTLPFPHTMTLKISDSGDLFRALYSTPGVNMRISNPLSIHTNVREKFSQQVSDCGLRVYSGMDIFETSRTERTYSTHLSQIAPPGTILMFRDDFSKGKNKNTESKFFTHDFPDIDKQTNKTLLEIDGISSAACIYETPHKHHLIVVPLAFWRLFDGCKTKAQHQERLKVILHKLGSAMDSKLNSLETRRARIETSVNSALTAYYHNSVTDKRHQIANAEERRDSLRDEYTRQHRQVSVLRMELTGLEDGKTKVAGLQNVIKEQLDELYSVNKVKDIKFTDNCIIFETNFLYFFNPDTRVKHQLGEMTISVNMVSFSFSFKNKTMKFMNSYDHPHINNGSVCFGNFGLGLPELLMEGQIYTFIDLILAFLETCNPKDEWGKNAIYWPIEDESLSVETWADLKGRRRPEYIMEEVVRPKLPKSDTELLDEVEDGIETQRVIDEDSLDAPFQIYRGSYG